MRLCFIIKCKSYGNFMEILETVESLSKLQFNEY